MDPRYSIDNLEVVSLREEDVSKEEEKMQRDAARAARGCRGGGVGVVVGWAGGVVR